MSRRRSRSSAVTTIYWRDIPAQVTATTAGGHDERIMLHPRFQHAIDRAATVAGLTETHQYIEQWRRVTTAAPGDVMAEAQSCAEGIDCEYHRQRLEALVANGGLEPAAPPTADEPATTDERPSTNDKETQLHG